MKRQSMPWDSAQADQTGHTIQTCKEAKGNER
jgi:hypothetical protein